MHAMLADYERGEGQGVSFMARVNDLRYDAQVKHKTKDNTF